MTREEAKKTLQDMWETLFNEMTNYTFEDLKEHGMLDNYQTALDMAISALSAEGEYIKKEDAINAIRKSDHYGQKQKIYVCHREVVDSIDELPTYSFPEREKGEWIFKNHHWECSCCGGNPTHGTGFVPSAETMKEHYKFCNLCGADMKGDKAE